MKVTIDLEWRWLEEPDHHLEGVLTKALKEAGYEVGRIFIQGHHLEDKPKIKFSRTIDRPATRAVEIYEEAKDIKGREKRRKEKIKKLKRLTKGFEKPVRSRKLLKKRPRATYVLNLGE